MKVFVKILATLILLFAVVMSGIAFYITRGLAEGKDIVIEQIEPTKLADGIYEGKYNAGRWSNQVKVKIEAGKIVKVDVVKRLLFEKPEITKQVISNVIEKQDTRVDIVSGATVSCKAYLKSIENALSK